MKRNLLERGGTCKRGERSDLTGCSPASGGGGGGKGASDTQPSDLGDIPEKVLKGAARGAGKLAKLAGKGALAVGAHMLNALSETTGLLGPDPVDAIKLKDENAQDIIKFLGMVATPAKPVIFVGKHAARLGFFLGKKTASALTNAAIALHDKLKSSSPAAASLLSSKEPSLGDLQARFLVIVARILNDPKKRKGLFKFIDSVRDKLPKKKSKVKESFNMGDKKMSINTKELVESVLVKSDAKSSRRVLRRSTLGKQEIEVQEAIAPFLIGGTAAALIAFTPIVDAIGKGILTFAEAVKKWMKQSGKSKSEAEKDIKKAVRGNVRESRSTRV